MVHSHNEILAMRMNNLQLQNNRGQPLKLRVEQATHEYVLCDSMYTYNTHKNGKNNRLGVTTAGALGGDWNGMNGMVPKACAAF